MIGQAVGTKWILVRLVSIKHQRRTSLSVADQKKPITETHKTDTTTNTSLTWQSTREFTVVPQQAW
jgi:hypothetical protein